MSAYRRVPAVGDDHSRLPPPIRCGFGLELIERLVAYELGGQAVLDHLVEGLSCEITVPLTDSVGTCVSGAQRSAGSGRRH
jgi:two-component sensor histidine kinase